MLKEAFLHLWHMIFQTVFFKNRTKVRIALSKLALSKVALSEDPNIRSPSYWSRYLHNASPKTVKLLLFFQKYLCHVSVTYVTYLGIGLTCAAHEL